MKKILSLLLILFIATSCASKQKIKLVDKSDEIYVRKIENIPDDFIFGVDASEVISLENSGVKYYDYNGEECDVFKVLAQSGVTHIRVRVWNDPYDENGNGYGGGNCDINNAIEIGKRASQYGLKMIIDFHYSDFWADPSKQMCPKAWVGMEIEDKAEALYQYTKDCLTQLKNAKVDVAMVSLGNETNGAMAGEKNWMNIVYYLMGAGSKATREVLPKALIAVHFANPEKSDQYMTYASKLAYYDLDYDVFSSSYYPYWHGTLENLNNTLSAIAEKYNKKVMVMETSYCYTDEDSDFNGNTISSESSVSKNYPFSAQGQVNCLLDVIETAVNMKNGIGVCYWGATWITVGTNSYEENFKLWETYGSGWASSYAAKYDPNDAGKYYGGCACDNQALFDRYGKPLESLKTFALCKTGNQIESSVDSILDTTVQIDLNDEVILPAMVDAVMNDGSKKQVNVTWDGFDENEFKSNGPKTYTVKGTAEGMSAVCYVDMIEYNYLVNPDFEEDENGQQATGWKAIALQSIDQLYVEDKSSDSLSGSKHFHFWAAMSGQEFKLEQTLDNLNGKYKFTMSIMGGDCGDTDIYLYAIVGDTQIKSEQMTITSYNNWDTMTLSDIEVNEGQSLTVGIYVKVQGAGGWGKIDKAMLNSQK